jgi:hypothetical protein
MLVRAGSQGRERVPIGPAARPLRPTPLLAGLLQRAQVKYQPRPSDPEMLDLCRELGLLPSHVTLISIAATPGGGYAIIAQGSDGDYVRRLYPDLRAFAVKASTALQIVALRREIRGG